MTDFLASYPADLSECERDGRLSRRGFVHAWRSAVAPGNGESFFDSYVRSVLSESFVVLDVGCGHGSYAMSLAAHCRRVVGLDRDWIALALARELAAERSVGNVAFVPAEFGAGEPIDLDIDLPDGSVDLFVCRRGPVLAKWLPLALRLARGDAMLVGIHPTGDPVADWTGELSESLRFGGSFDYAEVRAWVTAPLDGEPRARLHGCWWFDVPERFDDPAQLHARLAGRPGVGSYDQVRPELDALFARHGGSVDVRHRRLVWRVDVTG